MTRLSRRDWGFIAACVVFSALSLAVILRWFGDAFPEASIEFEYDRTRSRAVAEQVLRDLKLDPRPMKHSVVFESDDFSRIFLERSLGLERANRAMTEDVLVWYWRHRWFVPLQQEEYAVEVAPTGEIVSFARTIPEAMPMPPTEEQAARKAAEDFLRRVGIDLSSIKLVSQSERKLPARIQRIFTWESKRIRPGGAPYRFVATVDGGAVTSFARRLRVPEEWIRSYRELRSKNEAAGRIDLVFMMITMIAALAVFIARIRRGDLQIRFLLAIGAVTAVLTAGVAANSFPSALAGYDTTSSYPYFIAQIVLLIAVQSIGSAMLLIVICGAGEVLYRERTPQHLAIPRLWTKRALASRRVFLSLILGYTLVGLFIAYQVAFYIVAGEFGAWAPADIPYDDILNTAFPWIAVLFAGFFPAFSEEFLSRAFSIPFFERILRSRIFAIVLAGFIWGFGHATYPQQPFYIRGLEVGLAGVLLGFLMYRYGLLALLIWHYTVDAVYTSLLLFRSGNAYYIASAAVASLVFAVPLVISIALYIRNRGFLPDDDLTNAALPPLSPPPPPAVVAETPLPDPVAPTIRRLVLALVAIAAAAALIVFRPASPDDVVDYQTTAGEAKSLAQQHLRDLKQPLPPKIAAIPVSGFRSWDEGSSREEGGTASGFDEVAATYMVQSGMPVERLTAVMRDEIHAATWMVRQFTPGRKTEYFIEIDPRTARVIGYHKYADENARGDQLEREAARAIAESAFARYGVKFSEFEVREALSFQQPNRRDWLFHFDEKKPLAAEAFRRVTVRLMGSEITQFINTVRIPDAVYREVNRQTLGTIVFIILKIAGIVISLALVIAGAIMVTRHGGMAWRQALKLTALFAIIPIAGVMMRNEQSLFAYSTTTAWQTFQLNVITDGVRSAGGQILLIFLALLGILSVYPNALRLLGREGRARLGTAAAIAAATAAAVMAIYGETVRRIERLFPSRMHVDEVRVPAAVGLPVPSLLEAGEALFGAVVLSGAVALFVTATAQWRRRWLVNALTAAMIFCVSVDIGAAPREVALMLLFTAGLTAVIWLVTRFILGTNLLAWPAAALVTSLLQSAGSLLQNHRQDLFVHGMILLALAAAAIMFLATSPRRATE
ncbi:MAG TPA: type II CAAX endopeptidase family protein [Thermoanaerobaculia bacterium]|nr:type II CAAX endopeptidase family protein [Thermoanaerobaculia bacterium]